MHGSTNQRNKIARRFVPRNSCRLRTPEKTAQAKEMLLRLPSIERLAEALAGARRFSRWRLGGEPAKSDNGRAGNNSRRAW
ncbi:hypothetical protein V5799_016955 [Amblyomma americanum]|uniref:Uncharacterized protein n=1 Tax=Amblyomma americanum TaxID=6943 RepID=A0AAQ4F3I0_AMBAM